jgi:SAM-dependent methyltransferase
MERTAQRDLDRTYPIAADGREANRRFYDPMWTDARLVAPDRFNTWPLVASLAVGGGLRLEVGPGLRPRLPIDGTYFVDMSPPAVGKLRAHGAHAVLGLACALPFPDRTFRLVCALDVVEHVDDEDAVLAELGRVAAPGAALLLSVPLHPAQWTAFDDFVGHRRRYEPDRLVAKLAEHGFAVERSAVYGMTPQSSRLLDLGMWWLTHRRSQAMWWYGRVFMPLAMRFQKKLRLAPGVIATDRVDEILVVCRREAAPA